MPTQLTVIVPADHVAQTRQLARELFEIPENVVISRERFGFGGFVEYPLIPIGSDPETTEPTHYFCSDIYGTVKAFGLKAFVEAQNLPWLEVLEGDVRPILAARNLTLGQRLPEYPPQIWGVDR